MSKTLNDYIEKLKPLQQDYIVHCVQEFSNRPDFHRGLLPFLEAKEAALCLRTQLDHLETVNGLGQKFIKQIISVFAYALENRLYEDEEHCFLELSSAKMKKCFGVYKMSGKFCIRLKRYMWGVDKDRLAELQMVSRNMWRVTSHKDDLANVSLWLVDNFR